MLIFLMLLRRHGDVSRQVGAQLRGCKKPRHDAEGWSEYGVHETAVQRSSIESIFDLDSSEAVDQMRDRRYRRTPIMIIIAHELRE